MKKPMIRYLVASPTGDIPPDTSKLDFPLEKDPLKTSYRAYFSAITDFLTKENCIPFFQTIKENFQIQTSIDYPREIVIRAEKHGAFYHPASIELLVDGKRIKFGLNVAITEKGKHALMDEFYILKMLHSKFNLPYIPKPYYIDELNSMVFLLEEWFEDYHEFHISNTKDGKKRLKLWEYGKGNRFLTNGEAFEIYRQATMILTLYYDIESFRLIFPWHHAAGDFVVKIVGFLDKKIDVRLTTARGYQSFMGFDDHRIFNPKIALVYFLLFLSIQMRIDKIDGLNEIVWADDFCVDATIKGFFQGLNLKTDFRNYFYSTEEFIQLLKSFSKKELMKIINPLVNQYKQTKDFPIINQNLKQHIGDIYSTLRNSL